MLASTAPLPPPAPAEEAAAAGGGTTAGTGETVVTINTVENQPKTIPVSESSGLSSITLTTTQTLQGIILTISTVSEPTNIPAPEGEINRYISIKEQNILPFQVKSAKIKFKVSKTWITDHNALPENIILTRWDGIRWTELPTTQIGSDNIKYIYEAESPGLSIYAIVAKVYIPGVTKLDLSAKLRQIKNSVITKFKDIEDTINFAKERGIPIEEIFPMFTSLKQKLDAALNAEKIGNLATALVLFQDAGDFANNTATTLKSTIETQFSQLIIINQTISYAILLLVVLMLYDKRRIFFNILGDFERLISGLARKAQLPKLPKPKLPSLPTPKYIPPKPAFKAPPFKPPSFKAPSFKLPRVSLKLPSFKAPAFKLPTFKAPSIKVPSFKAPKLSVPKINVPKFELPSLPKAKPMPKPVEVKPKPLEIEEKRKYELPKFNAPKVSLPSFRLPAFKVPTIRLPTFKAPKLPLLKIPAFKTPKISVPKFKAPKFSLPKMPAYKPAPRPVEKPMPSKPLISLPKIEVEFKPASKRKKEK